MRVFVDTSIILAFLVGQDDRALEIIRRIERREITGYINPLVIDETIYGYLRLATGHSARRIRKLLARRDERLIRMIKDEVQPILKLFTTLPLAAEPGEVAGLIEEHGLMPADALIALTCKQHEISVIATLDEDFKQIPWLKVIP
ncbi:MAG: PIN domain-containing protein [Desulfurococcales archaeon]|nr:PIN domain-containing protein [Desulfurococcales archaeon]